MTASNLLNFILAYKGEDIRQELSKRHASTIILMMVCSLLFSQGVSSQILSYKTTIEIEDDGTKTTQSYFHIRIQDKEHNWLSHIEIDHNTFQKLNVDFVRIIDSSKRVIRQLKKKEIKTRNAFANDVFFQDNMITEFDLYWNEYPYEIEYSYSVEEKSFLYVAQWTPVLHIKTPTYYSSLEITIPNWYPINIYQTDNFNLNEETIDERKKLFWETNEETVLKRDLMSPPINDLIPHVYIVPENFNYGVEGSCKSWSSFGNWFYRLNKDNDEIPFSEKIKINNLIKGIDDKREIIKTLYYYLQDQTRYIFVDLDFGGFKSYSAAYVSQHKYGDCKALTTYMKSMLKYIDIESFYILVNAGSNETKVNNDFPSQQFNHVILLVPLAEDTIWLENTSNSLPFDYLGTFTQNRWGLRIDSIESNLIQTPKLKQEDVSIERTYNYSAQDEKSWNCNINLNISGRAFESFRQLLQQKDKQEQENLIQQLIKTDRFELKEWALSNFRRESTDIRLDIKASCFNKLREIGDMQVLKPLGIKIPKFESPTERSNAVRINIPISKTDRITYQLDKHPPRKIQLPDDINLISEFGKYWTRYHTKNNIVEVEEGLTIYQGEISINKYINFYKFLTQIQNHKKNSVIVLQ